ncbi:acid trehalase protein [Rutstroemia sp. NJR-2017a BBW]|nr:acid trehalase protein [Rutstroemia sp. NJR-2017a BBW]
MAHSTGLALGAFAFIGSLVPAVFGADVNPASPFKFKTKPDANITLHDFGVFAESPLSFWDDEKLTLTTTTFIPGEYRARMGLANGYIGIGEASLGPFFETDFNQTNHDGQVPIEGWPEHNRRQTFATIAGFFDRQAKTKETNYPELQDRGDESVISGIPHFSGMHVLVGGQVLNSTVDPSSITKFESSMDYRNGIKSWSFLWTPEGTNSSMSIEYLTFMSRARPNVAATQLQITSLSGLVNASIMDVLDGRSAIRSFAGERGSYNSTPSIFTSNHPDGLPDIAAWTVSTVDGSAVANSRTLVYPNSDTMTMAQQWDVQLVANNTATFHKFVGIASTDKFPDPESVASQASLNATRDGWDALLAEHTAIWNNDIQQSRIPSYRDPTTGRLPPNDMTAEKNQITAVVNYYMLIQSLWPENGDNLNDNGVSVGGLTADPYAGMYFWDQDIWMFPSIAITSPKHALQIIKYRLKSYSQARRNAQEDYVQEKYKFDNESVLYSWTAGRYGNATGTGPALDYEYHLNADVAMTMLQYRMITGDEEYFRRELWPVVKSVGHMIEGVLEKDGEGKWNIHNMTDPDEWTNHVDNGAFTQASFLQVMNAIIAIQEQYNETTSPTWVDIAQNINIPRAPSGITLEYEGMPSNITIKQADVTMFMYPLSLPATLYPLHNKNLDLSFYTSKQTLDGPAMTFAITTIATMRYAPSSCSAQTYSLLSGFANYRAPWYQMSEQTNDDQNANGGYHPAFPFLTGHGGAALIPIFGNLGLDLWAEELTVQPTLPEPVQFLQLPDFFYKGHKISAQMNTTHTNITLLSMSPFAPSSSSIPLTHNLPASRHPQVQHQLLLNQTLTLPNDMYWQTLSTLSNLLQCLPAHSTASHVPGRWPRAINDGDVGTSWQAAGTGTAGIDIDTSAVQGARIREVRVVWGERVAEGAWVVVSGGEGASETRIDISGFVEGRTESEEVVPYEGKRTVYTVPANETVYLGSRVRLEVEGCVGAGCGENGDEAGATVGEFEVLEW